MSTSLLLAMEKDREREVTAAFYLVCGICCVSKGVASTLYTDTVAVAVP